MTRKMGVRWHLREVMATRGMFSTTDLIAPLAERGVVLSREQVYRLVTGQPERLNVHALAALCDLLDCGVGDLLEPVVEQRAQRKRASGAGSGEESAQKRVRDGLRPVRARIVDPGKPPKA
jgi:DNA-binding Xre family transcriptional regulator